MEKRSPHCPLPRVRILVEAGKVRTTQTARAGADALGFSYSDMLAVVLALLMKLSSPLVVSDVASRMLWR